MIVWMWIVVFILFLILLNMGLIGPLAINLLYYIIIINIRKTKQNENGAMMMNYTFVRMIG